MKDVSIYIDGVKIGGGTVYQEFLTPQSLVRDVFVEHEPQISEISITADGPMPAYFVKLVRSHIGRGRRKKSKGYRKHVRKMKAEGRP